MLEQAERLQQQFFLVGTSWEPPFDMYETEDAFVIRVAMPGVCPDKVEVSLDGDVLVVAGRREIASACAHAFIHRQEIPHGCFERRIRMPSQRVEMGGHALVDGCLVLSLRKLR